MIVMVQQLPTYHHSSATKHLWPCMTGHVTLEDQTISCYFAQEPQLTHQPRIVRCVKFCNDPHLPVTSVGEGCNHKTGGVSQVLITIRQTSIDHPCLHVVLLQHQHKHETLFHR